MNNSTVLNDIQFEIGPLIESLIEYCKQTFDRIKSSFSNENRYAYLEEINENLNKISRVLWKHSDIFDEELTCYAEIEHYIIYIIAKNCENNYFEHMECTIYLLNIFKSLMDAKFNYLKDHSKLPEYQQLVSKYPNELHEFRMYFNKNIFVKNYKFDKQIRELNKILRDD